MRERHSTRIAAAAAGTTLLVGGGATALTHWPEQAAHVGRRVVDAHSSAESGALASAPADGGQAAERWLRQAAARPAITPRADSSRPTAPAARPARHRGRHRAPAPPVYANPLRGVTGLVAERIDMGVDFGGSGPVYALGNAVITSATASSAGWPGGGWITYRLTDGPASGLSVFVAEDVTPAVQVGEQVSSSTVIANMFDGGAGIETGWAQPDGSSAESQLPEAGGISGGGPFPTKIGVSFEDLLVALGVAAGSNSGQPPYGVLPPNYPAAWNDDMLRS